MRFKGLDLNLLVALDKLLTYRSVTQAAEMLHITQSAASSALARLREALGDELLVQSGKQMLLTRFGEELREQVREILMRIDATMYAKPDFVPAACQRRFHIVCSDFVAEVLMVRVQREIAQMAPGMSLNLIPPVSAEVFSMLQRGEVDLVIAPDHYCQPQHLHATLFSDPWICLAWSGNTAVGETISLEQYAEMDHVVLQPFGQVALDQHFFDTQKVQRRAMVAAPVFTLLPKLIIGTSRLATVPSRLIGDYERLLPLKIVRRLFDMPPLVEAMQWHPSRDRDTAFAWLRGQMLKAAQDDVSAAPAGSIDGSGTAVATEAAPAGTDQVTA